MSLIIFDLDGTLSDSHQAIIGCFIAACEDNGQAPPSEDAVSAMIGLPLTTMFEALAPDGPQDDLVATYKSTYVAFDKQHTRLFDGVRELLHALPGPLAIATSKGVSGATRTLRMFGIEDQFAIVLGFDSVERPKPAPDMILEALRRSGHSADEAVMVGDTTFDLEMADAAGVRAIAVGWGAHSAQKLERWRRVDTVDELLAALT